MEGLSSRILEDDQPKNREAKHINTSPQLRHRPVA